MTKRSLTKPALAFGREIVTQKISLPISLALMLFFAGSIASTLPSVSIELSQASDVSLAPLHDRAAIKPELRIAWATAIRSMGGPRVLGQTTYSPQNLINNKEITITVSPIDYDQAGGKWNYFITWSRRPGGTGSVVFNGKVIASKVKGAGSYYTDYVLSPNMAYRLVFYSKANAKGSKLFNKTFMTLVEPVVATPAATDDGSSLANSGTSQQSRVGYVVVTSQDNVELITSNGLIDIPSIDVFNSWCFSIQEVLKATLAEEKLPIVATLPMRVPGQTLPFVLPVLRIATCKENTNLEVTGTNLPPATVGQSWTGLVFWKTTNVSPNGLVGAVFMDLPGGIKPNPTGISVKIDGLEVIGLRTTNGQGQFAISGIPTQSGTFNFSAVLIEAESNNRLIKNFKLIVNPGTLPLTSTLHTTVNSFDAP